MRGRERLRGSAAGVGGLRKHAMRAARLLRSAETVGTESGSQGGTGWKVRGVAGSRSCNASRAGNQAGRWRRGTNGAGTLNACGYDVLRGHASRKRLGSCRQAWCGQAAMARAGGQRMGCEAPCGFFWLDAWTKPG
eukprot:scaffold26576_cov77-Phaeocystis_antarctica.AAC.1